jgi:hypothetical protein
MSLFLYYFNGVHSLTLFSTAVDESPCNVRQTSVMISLPRDFRIIQLFSRNTDQPATGRLLSDFFFFFMF